MRKVNIGLVGCGTVGSGVVQGLARNGSLMGSRLGVKLSLAGVAVRNAGKARAARVAKRLITTDWESLVRDPKIDVVMELMGGTTTARKVVAENPHDHTNTEGGWNDEQAAVALAAFSASSLPSSRALRICASIAAALRRCSPSVCFRRCASFCIILLQSHSTTVGTSQLTIVEATSR